MNLGEKLERAGWVIKDDTGNVFVLLRGEQRILFNWIEQEVELVSGTGIKSYIPNEHEVEILCEKVEIDPEHRILSQHYGLNN